MFQEFRLPLWTLYLIESFLSKFVGCLCQSIVFKIWNIFLECSLRSLLRDSQGFSLDKSFFNTWQVTKGEMYVLEGFCFLKKKCVYPARIDFFLNLVHLYTTINLVPRFSLLQVGENPGNEVVQPQQEGHLFHQGKCYSRSFKNYR